MTCYPNLNVTNKMKKALKFDKIICTVSHFLYTWDFCNQYFEYFKHNFMPFKIKKSQKIVNYIQNSSVTSLTVRNPGIFCLRDAMINLHFSRYMVWFIYHLNSIFREKNLRQKEISAHSTGSMPCISPTPLSKLLSYFFTVLFLFRV